LRRWPEGKLSSPFSTHSLARQFIARKESGIKTLSDLKGRSFCFGELNSTLTTDLPRVYLGVHGVNPERDLSSVKYAGFAEDIAVAVYEGQCDAGSTYVDVLSFAAETLKKKHPDILTGLDIFYVTGEIPNDGVQFARNVEPRIKHATADALVKMAADNPGKNPPLVTLYKIEGFARATNDFYGEFAALVKRSGLDPASFGE
jgi:phosphonate transport system substrate-binding protein